VAQIQYGANSIGLADCLPASPMVILAAPPSIRGARLV